MWSQKEPMRCNACRRAGGHGRFTLPQRLSTYVYPPKCPYCKSTEVVSYRKHRTKAVAKRKREGKQCYCHAYSFPHQQGNMRFCIHNKKLIEGVEPTKEEMLTDETIQMTYRGS